MSIQSGGKQILIHGRALEEIWNALGEQAGGVVKGALTPALSQGERV